MYIVAQFGPGNNRQNGGAVAGGSPGRGAPLGSTTISVTPPPPDADGVLVPGGQDQDQADALAVRRVSRYKLQDAARELLPGERVCFCCRTIRPDQDAVNVLYSPEAGRAHYGGLMVCVIPLGYEFFIVTFVFDSFDSTTRCFCRF